MMLMTGMIMAIAMMKMMLKVWTLVEVMIIINEGVAGDCWWLVVTTTTFTTCGAH